MAALGRPKVVFPASLCRINEGGNKIKEGII
jgi:hypothetical protein